MKNRKRLNLTHATLVIVGAVLGIAGVIWQVTAPPQPLKDTYTVTCGFPGMGGTTLRADEVILDSTTLQVLTLRRDNVIARYVQSPGEICYISKTLGPSRPLPPPPQ